MIGASLQFLVMRRNLHAERTKSIREDVIVVPRNFKNNGEICEGAARVVLPLKIIYLKLWFVILSVFYCLKTVVLGGDNLCYQLYVVRFLKNRN